MLIYAANFLFYDKNLVAYDKISLCYAANFVGYAVYFLIYDKTFLVYDKYFLRYAVNFLIYPANFLIYDNFVPFFRRSRVDRRPVEGPEKRELDDVGNGAKGGATARFPTAAKISPKPLFKSANKWAY